MNATIQTGELWASRALIPINTGQVKKYTEHFENTARILERAARMSKKKKSIKLSA